ncbi:MAG: hypothetical protein ACRESZ_06835 [Methylococcales bacterium]
MQNLMGIAPHKVAPAVSYPNYPFGARHLQAFALAALSVDRTMLLCGILSYASILALALAAWCNAPAMAVRVVLPIGLALVFAFEQHRYADDMTFSPGVFVGFFALAVFLAARRIFERPRARIGFFTFLGGICAYLDILHGVIPVMLSLAIVLNHFFYARREQWRAATLEAATIVGCFVFAFIVLTGGRLLVLSSIAGTDWPVQFFMRGLSFRLGDFVPGIGRVGIGDVAQKLWNERSEMTGNKTASTVLLITASVSWLVSALLLLVRDAATRTDMAVLALAGGGILIWYAVFLNHTHIHAWLMVRMLALPVAYGFAAALLSVRPFR